MTDLAGQRAFITGGASGIGRATALALAERGVEVCVADLQVRSAERVAAEIQALGVRALAVQCDVSDRAGVRAAAAEVTDELGSIDILFANAGVTSFREVADHTDEDWDWLYGVDVFGVTNCLQAFLPHMIFRGRGHVVTTASMAGLIPTWQPRHALYSSAKALVIALTVNMRPELAAHGIGSTVVCPGGVRTQILQTSAYRPERFAGPIDEPPIAPSRTSDSAAEAPPGVRDPDEVAAMTLEAIEHNHLFVVTDGSLRSDYSDYADQIYEAFDRVDADDTRQSLRHGHDAADAVES